MRGKGEEEVGRGRGGVRRGRGKRKVRRGSETETSPYTAMLPSKRLCIKTGNDVSHRTVSLIV